MATRFVIKRNGTKAEFDGKKIASAVARAFRDVYASKVDEAIIKSAEEVAKRVTAKANEAGKDEISVEELQNITESTLMEFDPKVAKAYILYRNKRAEIRAFKASLGVQDDELKMPINSLTVLAARYLKKDENNKVIETPKLLFQRVATAIAEPERNYGKNDAEVKAITEEFYNAMTRFEFMPNSPTLMNAGMPEGSLSACFVLPVGDSIEEIFDALKYTAMIHKFGGGTGFAFSRLRPSNDIVRGSSGVSSGPISFMRIFDATTEQIKQGGKRRGANMGILRIDHPDILNFIMAKDTEGTLRNFNISVAVTDTFMKALSNDSEYELINPRNKRAVGKLNARAVWNLIITMAWKTGDPGLVFIDRMNSTFSNPVPNRGPIESTNPCGEQPLYPYDSCNLGSINLANMVKREDDHYEVDWEKLDRTVRTGVRFLDNVIDANKFPVRQISEITRMIRRIGLGVMGWADMLIKLGIVYNSNEALVLAERVMGFISEKSREMSEELAGERGPFPDFENSIWYKLGYKPLRNSTTTTIAPTGTISIITGGASQGIEPLFSVAYMRNVKESLGSNLIEVDNEFEQHALEDGFYSEELMKKIAGMISIQDVDEIPEGIRRLFVTAFDISPEWHVKMQAAFQKYTDNAVSKTINFPNYATPQDIENAYTLAYKLGCKGITVYRDGSKSVQVLQAIDQGASSEKQRGLHESKQEHAKKQEAIRMASVKDSATTYVLAPAKQKSCPSCGNTMIAAEGCFTCPKCGFSECS